jgi:hypothetical protein
MSYADSLKELLRPLGVYALENGLGAGLLSAEGTALDGCSEALDCVEREMFLATAEGDGLDAVEALLTHRPVANSVSQRREALAALLRVGGDSFTLPAINDNLTGCGLNAVAKESDTPETVEVRFPEVPGIPDGFAQMQKIIEDILPCHLQINYIFWYITWAMMETRFGTWETVADGSLSWETLEKSVIP